MSLQTARLSALEPWRRRTSVRSLPKGIVHAHHGLALRLALLLRPHARDDVVLSDLGARRFYDLGRRDLLARTQFHRLFHLAVHVELETLRHVVLTVLTVLESQNDRCRRGVPDRAFQRRDRPVDNRRSVTVTYAVRTVPMLTLFRGITTPSIVAVLPGLSWKSRDSPLGIIFTTR